MSAKLDRIIKELKDAIRGADKRKTTSYDTPATVRRIDGDTAWVHIDGGIDETPVKRTIDAKTGDTVQVRVGGGKAWLTGNQTAPPTDDTVAHESAKTATDYVTDTNDGIFVHRNNDNKNGVRIRNNVDIVRNGKSVANYGEVARIGRTDGARMVVGSDNIQGINESGYELFRLGFDGETDLIAYFNDNIMETDVTSYQGTVATFSAELPSILPVGATFHITLNSDGITYVIFDDMEVGVASSQTKAITDGDYTLSYNGKSTITITGLVYQSSVVPSRTVTTWWLRCHCSTTIKTPSFTLGNRRTGKKGKYSVALGESLVAEADHQVVIGLSNVKDDDASFIVGNAGNIFTVKKDGDVYAEGDYFSGVDELSLGTMILPAVLTSDCSDLYFSIPTGRVFPSGTTISGLRFHMNGRAGSSEGQGAYIIRGSSGGTDTALFEKGVGNTYFYNANNNQKIVTQSMWTVSLQGGTSILVRINGGENYFFSGNTTKNGYHNNQPVVLYLTNITVAF